MWPCSADRFLSPSPLPPPPLFMSPSRQWRGWHVARGEGRDGSSNRRKSLPPGKLASDARPHGPLTYCLCDLWRLGASGHCRLLSSVSPRAHCRIARSHTHCTTVCGSIRRGIPRARPAAARAPIQPPSHTEINPSINISTPLHRAPDSLRTCIYYRASAKSIVRGRLAVMACQLL